MIYILPNKGLTLTCLAKQNRQTKIASAAWIILTLAYGTYCNYHGIEPMALTVTTMVLSLWHLL